MPPQSDAATLRNRRGTAIDQRTSSDAEPLELNFELTSKDRVAAAWMRLVGLG